MSGRRGQREWRTRTAKDRTDSETRRALLDAAEELFAEQGCDHTPIGQIAARAGTSRATFYVYFADRQEVFLALAHRVGDEIRRVQREAARVSTEPSVVVATSIRAALSVYAREMRLLTVIRHQALRDPQAERLWTELLAAPTRINSRFLARLRHDRGAVPVDSDDTVAEVVTASLLHVAALVAADPASLDERADALVAVYARLAGLPSIAAGPTDTEVVGQAVDQR